MQTGIEAKEIPQLTKEEAKTFFAELYYGAHHIPGYEPREYGCGQCIMHDRAGLATSDFNELTRFVLMCHEYGYRGEVSAARNGILRIAIWKRDKGSVGISTGHPSIEKALESFTKRKKL